MNTLERIQYQAALAITCAWKGTNLSNIYEEFWWESLSDRRWSRRLFQFYKIQNNLTPFYLKIPVPPVKARILENRFDKILNDIRCNTISYSNRFYPDSVRYWKNIGSILRNSIRLKKFKENIFAIVRPPCKKNFNTHNRQTTLAIFLSPFQ